MSFKTIEYKNEKLYLIDQRKLPVDKEYFVAEDYEEVAFGISDMVVRGAPAIGATAAYGMLIGAKQFSDSSKKEFINSMEKVKKCLKKSRPTAVNLFWAVKRMDKVIQGHKDSSIKEIIDKLTKEAEKIYEEDIKTNKKMAKHGNEIVPKGANIIHHCNTGALATVDYGTALGVVREAHYTEKNIHVYVNETRPRLQGARLTGFELVEEDIPATVIVDSVAPTLIKKGEIDLILVGADRIASNGDVANKIGTFMLSVAAKEYDVPFYTVAPTSTIDFEIKSGKEIEIEERNPEEVTKIGGVKIAPEGINVYNPAFDVTPAENVTGIITEKGILSPPYKETIGKLKS